MNDTLVSPSTLRYQELRSKIFTKLHNECNLCHAKGEEHKLYLVCSIPVPPKVRNGLSFYYWVLRSDPDNFRLLCWYCKSAEKNRLRMGITDESFTVQERENRVRWTDEFD